MGSSRRKVVWILCFLLLLLEATSAKNIWKRALYSRLPKKSLVSAMSAGLGRVGKDELSPDTVRSVSNPHLQAGRAGVFLYL